MTLDPSRDLAKNQSILKGIFHDPSLRARRAVIFKRQVIFGTCLVCLIQTGAIGYGLSNAMAEVTAGSGNNLLFGSKTELSQPSLDAAAPSAQQEMISEIEASAAAQSNIENADDVISQEDPVDLLADRVEYDEVAGLVSAIGNVELVQTGRILRAEKVTYNLKQDKVEAKGNVVLNEVTGDTYFADNVELKDKMKDGFVLGLSGVLADGSRFSAEEAEKIADLKMIMRKASYTPCEPCKKDPSKEPLWQLKADKITHHKDEQRISYEDATFEVYGTPIAYTPYFSHPDGSVDRKSGFLFPTVGADSDLGAIYSQEYYWSIAPDRDATIGAMVMTEEAPLIHGEYRQRFENADILISGGATYSSRIDLVNDEDVKIDAEERGHLFVDGRWDINEKWRAGTNLELVSDEQYFRQYDFSNKDVLENTVYVERFSDRDYGTVRAIRFKDIRISDRSDDQPNVLPEVYTRFLGDPNSLLGGRWSLEASALGLQREGNEQDMSRGTLEAGWQGRHVGSIGLVNTLDLTMRGDAYHANDREIANQGLGRSNSSAALRGFAQAHMQSSMPFEKQFETTQVVVEPLAAMTVGSNINPNNDIPNEDSQDVFLDMTNLFNANRFPGYDRIEDDSHATYGLRTGLYGDNDYQGEIFLGQSYRFDSDEADNPFPRGSGLSEQESDFVGNISARLGDRFRLNYATQLENKNLSSQRHEIDMSAKMGPFSTSNRYFYAKGLQGTDLDGSREQIRNSLRYQFTDEWAVFGATQYDLARETEGLRRVSYGLDYSGQCVTFLVTGQRTLTRDSSGDSGTEIMMRVGLKNLGEFQTSGFSVGSGD